MRVFADNLADYAMAGWPCIIPVPVAAKSPPPPGFTGADGCDTDPMQLVIWASTQAAESIALRMPDGVLGIDVDHYDKGTVTKRGADSLAVLEGRLGPLPATWASTARGSDDGPGPSRIMFFRVPAGRYVTKLGDSIEIIQRHHRYAVVAPSIHLEAGGVYRWYDPAGQPSASVPKPVEFAELPEAWVNHLREGATEAGPAAADVTSGQVLLSQLLTDERPPCAEMTSAAQTAVAEIAKASQGSRHDTTTARVHHLVQLGAAGHPGAGAVLTSLRDQWATLTAGEDREAEYDRMALTSARKAVTAVGVGQVPQDPCLLTGGWLGPVVEPKGGVGGSPDASGGSSGDSGGWSIYAEIGPEAFDPQVDTDRTLAEAVLERLHPVLRYAPDAGTWVLRRGPQWEVRGDLTEWAVNTVAPLMPRGNPSAELGTDEYRRAKRRARFDAAGSSSAIARKMRAYVADDRTSTSVLYAAELDTEPEILWAGGIPWDLRASSEVPTPANIDPGTPHLRTAAFTPEVRPTPLWDTFIAAVWPDLAERAWVLRVLSITLTGYPDAALPILLGPAGRGKTSVVALLMDLLGSYAHSADPRLLSGADTAHASIVVELKGRRLSFIDEGPRQGHLGQERLKQLTGGGALTGNAMRQNPITFRPTHTLVLTTNDEPPLTDPAVRRRVRLIPCEGDPEAVKVAEAALGRRTSDPAWHAEAPGVLAALMREAARWLADPQSAATEAAPARIRGCAEEIAKEQDPVLQWLEEETEPHDPGTSSKLLYEAFYRSCQAQGLAHYRIPSKKTWGGRLNELKIPEHRDRRCRYRRLRLRDDGGGWASLLPSGGTSAATPPNEPAAGPSAQPRQPTSATPSTSARPQRRVDTPQTDVRETPAEPDPAPVKKTATKATGSPKTDKAAQRAAALAEAAGERISLPAVLDRTGVVLPLDLATAQNVVAAAIERSGALTVAVETTGYPVGHRDYALRTVQLGDAEAAVDFDATDPQQTDVVRELLTTAPKLHAHSATADLVPLAAEGLCDESAWDRMHDTVIPAKLADPASTGSDPGLKKLADAVLGEHATTPGADADRGKLFKAGRWLTDTKVTTPVERSGWAQVDSACTTMVRYAASDVLDTAALAQVLPEADPVVMERERTVQRMTARVTHHGLRVDGEHVTALLGQHTEGREQVAERVRAFGIDNPGSDQQVGVKLQQLGAMLPLTGTGRPSVAKDVLTPLRTQPGPVGELADAVLDYRHHDTVIGTFLQPYHQLVEHGDGRTRPTIYTLGTDTGRMSCVSSDTLVEMPRDLTKYPLGVPITEVHPGDWVYAFDHERELVLRRVKWVAQTGIRQTLRITAENSQGHRLTLRATPDHLIRLRNGDWRAAGNLLDTPGRPRRDGGPRVMTMVRRVIDDGYVKFFPHSVARKGAGVKGGGKCREHRWVLEQVEGRRISTKADVHHIDGNRANNDPVNLEALPVHEHRGNRDLAWGQCFEPPVLYAGPTDYRVISIEPALVEPVWDMEVEEVHNFIANGICVHNCVRPNMQQLPREGGVRACITADPGQLLISADFSGVELRVAAALSGDSNLAQMIADGVDVHWEIARQVWGPDATKAHRYTAKRIVFGRIYGGGVPTLAKQAGVDESIAAAAVRTLDEMAPELAAWSRTVRELIKVGSTQFPTYAGRVIHLPARFPHKGPNYCIQGTARELLIDALLRWRTTRWGSAVLLPVHDEIVAAVPEDDAEEATTELVGCMTTELHGVPILAEASAPAYAWADAA